jgi:hypothetical protein
VLLRSACKLNCVCLHGSLYIGIASVGKATAESKSNCLSNMESGTYRTSGMVSTIGDAALF